MWFAVGDSAEASEPLLTIKDQFAIERYPFLEIFFEKHTQFVYLCSMTQYQT